MSAAPVRRTRLRSLNRYFCSTVGGATRLIVRTAPAPTTLMITFVLLGVTVSFGGGVTVTVTVSVGVTVGDDAKPFVSSGVLKAKRCESLAA